MKSDLAEIIFCSIVYPTRSSEINACLLAESLRAFAGKFSTSPIWFFMPDYGKPLSGRTSARLDTLGVKINPYQIEMDLLKFFFVGEVSGIALAESRAVGRCQYLVWLDSNTIVLQESGEFILPGSISLGYRPVHHLLLGSNIEQPLDPFWQLIYQVCEVSPERVFPMKPVVEDLQMRPYFNAGILATRPEKGLFRAWRDTFFGNYLKPDFQVFYDQDARYRIFMHQAILSGVILQKFRRSELLELPWTYNYPLHLFDQDATGMRPNSLEHLVTFRHEGFYRQADWLGNLSAGDSLKRWLAERVNELTGEELSGRSQLE